MSTIVLNKYISVEDFVTSENGSFLRFPHEQCGVPTTVCVTKCTVVTPKRARIYATDLYVFRDEIVTYDYLRKLPGFRGTVDYPAVRLIEVWEDVGDDGHVAFSHTGYMFVSAEVIDYQDVYPENVVNGLLMDHNY